MNFDWLWDRKNQIVILGIVLGGALLIGSPIFQEEKGEEALKAYQAWEGSGGDVDLESKLEIALKRAPVIATVLAPRIAQMRLIYGSFEKVKSTSFLDELQEICPQHAEFSAVTLLIAKGVYQEALERSVSLKGQLKEGGALWGANLGRIAFLQKEIGNRPGELAAWEEIKGLMETSPNSDSVKMLLKSFGREGISLKAYISDRESAIFKDS